MISSLARTGVSLSPAATLTLKLYALVAMVADHVDWMLFDSTLGVHVTMGRTVFPIFAYLLAHNLLRAEPGHLLCSVAPRMLVVGMIAHLPYVAAGGGQLLNVMFTLSLATAVVAGWRLGYRVLPIAAGLVAGVVVDYQWVGIAVIALSVWGLRAGWPLWLHAVIWTVVLWPINGNVWVLAALPIIWLASQLHAAAPRWRWLFYVAYPAHLTALLVVRIAMG